MLMSILSEIAHIPHPTVTVLLLDTTFPNNNLFLNLHDVAESFTDIFEVFSIFFTMFFFRISIYFIFVYYYVSLFLSLCLLRSLCLSVLSFTFSISLFLIPLNAPPSISLYLICLSVQASETLKGQLAPHPMEGDVADVCKAAYLTEEFCKELAAICLVKSTSVRNKK